MVDRVLEREDKFEVPDGYALPDLADLVPTGGRWQTADYHL